MRVLSIQNYQQLKLLHGFSKNKNNLSLLPYDVFTKQCSVSFQSGYNNSEVMDMVSKIEEGKAKHSGQGFQSAFYKVNENIGIKSPQPLYPNLQNADTIGNNNCKEFLVLKKLNSINPDIAVKPFDLIKRKNKAYLRMRKKSKNCFLFTY